MTSLGVTAGLKAELDVVLAQCHTGRESAERLCKRLEAPVEDGVHDGQTSPSGSEPGRILSSLASQRMALRTLQGSLLSARTEAERQAAALEQEISATQGNISVLREELAASRQKAEADAAAKAAKKKLGIAMAVQIDASSWNEMSDRVEAEIKVNQNSPADTCKLALDFVNYAEQAKTIEQLPQHLLHEDPMPLLSELLHWRCSPSQGAAYRRRDTLRTLLACEGFDTEVASDGAVKAVNDSPDWMQVVLSQELALRKRIENRLDVEQQSDMLRKLNRLSTFESEVHEHFIECNDLLSRLSSQQRAFSQGSSVAQEIEAVLPVVSIESQRRSKEETAQSLVAEIKRLRQEDHWSSRLQTCGALMAESKILTHMLQEEKASIQQLERELGNVVALCDQVHTEMQRQGGIAPCGSSTRMTLSRSASVSGRIPERLGNSLINSSLGRIN